MANTEGMADEYVQSLLFSHDEKPSIIPTSSSRRTDRQRTALERRMNLPMGESPSAKVVRFSGKDRMRNSEDSSKNSLDQVTAENEEQTQQEIPEEGTLAVIGAVVERSRRTRRRKDLSSNRTPGPGKDPIGTINGFPSVNKKLGTFIGKQPPKHGFRGKSPPVVKSSSSQASNAQPGDLISAARKDAKNMLANMTLDEIKQSQEELQAELSPEMIAFLKRRKMKELATAVEKEDLPEEHNNIQRGVPIKVDEEEKTRIAQVLASIKTYDDLDKAYHEEMGDLDVLPDRRREGDDGFQIACDLLRSTAPRQSLWAARTVSQRLVEDLSSGRSYPIKSARAGQWPYPPLLPVSLRCLLDSSNRSLSSCLLHTYALQSLYTLIRLRVVEDCDIDITCTQTSSASFYVLNFMEDAVPLPSPRDSYPPASVQPFSVQDGPPAAYASKSSSTSASADGKAFLSDPLWTLISKMRMIPRLAELIGSRTKHASSGLPNEAIISTCGILSMIGGRAPGAATAIVQHQSLLSDLKEIAFHGDHARRDLVLQKAVLILLCTLARQSRSTAAAIHVEDEVFKVMATKAATRGEYDVQRWALALSRTLVRYGLGLSILPTLMTMSATDISAASSVAPFSLAADYCSLYSCALHCVHVLNQQNGKIQETVSEQQVIMLSNISSWLSRSGRVIVLGNIMVPDGPGCKIDARAFVLLAARCRFAKGYFNVAWQQLSVEPPSTTTGTSSEFKMDESTTDEVENCLDALEACLQSDNMKLAVSLLLPGAYCPKILTTTTDEEIESSAAAFLEAFVALCLQMGRRAVASGKLSLASRTQSLLNDLAGIFALRNFNEGSLSEDQTESVVGRPRRGWLKRAYAAISTVLCATAEYLTQHRKAAQQTSFCLLGRLEQGEEHLALVVGSQDFLFESTFSRSNNRISESNARSPLSTMIVQELCRTVERRKQVDHCFKAANGFGITEDGMGPFGLQSLTWEYQHQMTGASSNHSDDHDSFLLPMGEFWLWKILAGGASDPSAASGLKDVSSVLFSTLSLIAELEEDSAVPCSYTRSLGSNGKKFYYLCNLCFQHEGIMFHNGDDDNSAHARHFAEILATRYLSDMDSSFGLDFLQECSHHSAKKPSSAVPAPSSEAHATTAQQEQEQMDALQTIITSTPPLSSDRAGNYDYQAAIAFCTDLCKAFLEYGAQYPLFTTCMRSFLAPTFPTRIRCFVIQELGGGIHKLLSSNTIPPAMDTANASPKDEPKNHDSVGVLVRLLNTFLPGGLPPVDGSARDASAFLDLLSDLGGSSRSSTQFAPCDKAEEVEMPPPPLDQMDFMELFVLSTLARSLAIACLPQAPGLGLVQKRLIRMRGEFASAITEVAMKLLESPGTKSDLIAISIEVFNTRFTEQGSIFEASQLDKVTSRLQNAGNEWTQKRL